MAGLSSEVCLASESSQDAKEKKPHNFRQNSVLGVQAVLKAQCWDFAVQGYVPLGFSITVFQKFAEPPCPCTAALQRDGACPTAPSGEDARSSAPARPCSCRRWCCWCRHSGCLGWSEPPALFSGLLQVRKDAVLGVFLPPHAGELPAEAGTAACSDPEADWHSGKQRTRNPAV